MAEGAVVGILRVLLTGDAAGLNTTLNQTAKRATAFGKDLGSIGRSASQIGQSLTTSLTLPLVGVAGAALKAGIDFDRAMNAINGVLQPTSVQMDQIRSVAIKMGADTAFSATEAAHAILELGKAGFDTDTAIASVDKVLQLAAASGLGMGDSAALAARSLNAFGLEAKDLDRVNDVLAGAVNKTSLEIGDMQVAFGYVGPIARGFGMSIEEVSAALGIMRDRGIAAETTGRALREGFSRLANPVKSVEEVMQQLGISSFTSNGKLLGLTEIVGLLQSKGITAAQSLKLFGDAAGPGMYALIQNGQQGLIDLTRELQNSDGAAKAMADSMMKGLPGAFERMRGSVETAWLSISKAIEPTVIRIADGVGALADLVTTRLVPAFMGLPAPVQTTIVGLAGAFAAAGPLIWGFGQLALAGSALVGAFGAAGIATKALSAAKGLLLTQLPTFTSGLRTVGSSMAVSSRAATVMTGVMQGLGRMMGVVGAAYAGWQIGLWVGEIDAVKDSIGRLVARFGEWSGIQAKGTVAAFDAMRAAEKLAEASKKSADGIGEVSAAAAALRERISGAGLAREVAMLEAEVTRLNASGQMTPAMLKRVEAEVAMLEARGAELSGVLAEIAAKAAAAKQPVLDAGAAAKRAAEQAAEAFKRLKEGLTGADSLGEASTLVRAITETGTAFRMTEAEAARYSQQLNDIITKQVAMGQQAPPALVQMAVLLDAIATKATDAATGAKLLADSIQQVTQQAPALATVGSALDNLVPLKAPVTSALGKTAGQQMLGDLKETLRTQMGPTIMQAFTGGGSIGKSVGGLIGGSLFKDGGVAQKAISGGVSKLIGKGIGSVVGSVIPGLGTLVGGLAGGAIGAGIGKLMGMFGEGKKVNGMRDEFVAAAGGMDALNARAQAAGVSLDRVLKAKKVKDFEAAVAELNQAFKELEENKATANDLFNQIMSAGSRGIPEAMQPTIEAFIKLGLLTDEQAEKLRELSNGSKVDVDQMKSDIDLFKGSIQSLGPTFRQAQIDQTAGQYINALERLFNGGADVGGVLFDAQEEISELVNQARAAGATLPENMRPWIEELHRAGLLVDENGEKLATLDDVKWGERQETEAEKAQKGWDKILMAIETLIEKISGPLDAAIGERRTMPIDVEWRNTGDGQPWGGGSETSGYSMATPPPDLGMAMDAPMPTAGALAYAGGAGMRGGALTINVMLPNGRTLAQAVVPEIPDVLRSYGLV